MTDARHTNLLTRLILMLTLFALILSGCNAVTKPASTQELESTPSPSPTSVPTLASLPEGGLVYGDPGGRFTLPLFGDWTPVETDGSYGHFRFADPVLDMYVVTVESKDLAEVADAALSLIELDPSALSEPEKVDLSRWTAYFYALGSDRGVTMAARRLDGATIAVILTGELSLTTVPPIEIFLSLDKFALIPLVEYLNFQPPPTPTTIETIENLNHIEFYSNRQKLVGRLVLPEGEGPFPAIVYVHDSGRHTRSACNIVLPVLKAAGFAVLCYDKRGFGESEGFFYGTHDLNGSPSPSERLLPQLADDALAAVVFLENLREINPAQIGVLGVSQAGWIIPVVTTRSNIPAFAVMIYGPTVSVGETHYHQELTGRPYSIPDMTESERYKLSEQLAAFDGPRGYDPRQYIEAMSIPGLWILGDRDGWIPARESKTVVERMITDHDKDFEIRYSMEYGHDGPLFLNEVVDWILTRLEE